MNNAALESRNKYCWGFVSWWSWHCISSLRNVLSLQFVYQLTFSRYSGQIDAKGKLQEPDKATSNHAYKMFQIIMTLNVMPRKVSHKEATDGSFYEGSDKYKIAGSLTTLWPSCYMALITMCYSTTFLSHPIGCDAIFLMGREWEDVVGEADQQGGDHPAQATTKTCILRPCRWFFHYHRVRRTY